MNDEDSAIAERWNAEKFVLFGRIAHKDVNRYGAYWCQLSNEAFALAAAERAARAERPKKRGLRERNWYAVLRRYGRRAARRAQDGDAVAAQAAASGAWPGRLRVAVGEA